MVAIDGVLTCPGCGWVSPDVAVAPLVLVTGASGAGKSTLLPVLRERLIGRCVVLDVDWLIGPITRAGRGEIDWDAFRDTWLHVAHGIAQNRLVPVLLGPFYPEQLAELPGRAWVGEIHTLLLDCDDDERRRRLEDRPRWRARDIDEQIAFGRWLRGAVPTAVDTTADDVAATAEAVVTWALGRLDGT